MKKMFDFLNIRKKKIDERKESLVISSYAAHLNRVKKSPLTAETITFVENENEADLKVYFTDLSYMADLLVFPTPYSNQSKGREEVWHITDISFIAKTKILAVKYPYLADLTVSFVRHPYLAQWRRRKNLKSRRIQFS